MAAIAVSAHPLAEVLRREVIRYVETARPFRQLRSASVNRRGAKRHDRECPIFVAALALEATKDRAATLRNISHDGLGFHCDAGLKPGSLISVKLFWSDPHSPRVPARVRHCEIEQEGFFIGAEFATTDPEACKLIERHHAHWYG